MLLWMIAPTRPLGRLRSWSIMSEMSGETTMVKAFFSMASL